MNTEYDYGFFKDEELLPKVIRHAEDLRPYVDQIFTISIQLKYLLDAHEKEMRVLAARRSFGVIEGGNPLR
ncbi:MAG: hypothetical protein EON58_11275 [Alphaproteobacteria bacterium]|nr:MAG: hypothetical protein EON58_11275 [Alphaproteobacteria bacterium]